MRVTRRKLIVATAMGSAAALAIAGPASACVYGCVDPIPLCEPGADAPARFNVIEGTNSSETIYGTSGRDLIRGLDGDDIIYGYSSDDILCGNDGDDTLNGGSGDDQLSGGAGNDTLNQGSGSHAKEFQDCEENFA